MKAHPLPSAINHLEQMLPWWGGETKHTTDWMCNNTHTCLCVCVGGGVKGILGRYQLVEQVGPISLGHMPLGQKWENMSPHSAGMLFMVPPWLGWLVFMNIGLHCTNAWPIECTTHISVYEVIYVYEDQHLCCHQIIKAEHNYVL